MSEAFGYKTCPVCGKGFVPAPQHVYKISKSNGGRPDVCSWSCLRAWEKKREAKRKHPKTGGT